MIPRARLERIEAALGASIRVEHRVSGGSIHEAYAARIDGERVFVKTSAAAPDGMFAAEARGLDLVRGCDALRVPAVVHVAPDALVLEWIDMGRGGPHFGRRLGEALAALHARTAPEFGLDHDNWIGRLPQPNGPHADWHAFYVARRIGAQLEQARAASSLPSSTLARLDQLTERWADLVPAPHRPALLHGDLWGGNHGCDLAGRPVLYDPAVSFGHPESDIGFTTLFGGFPAGFHAAWEAESGYGDAWREREALHHLYPLLVHATLFGGHYVSAVDRIARRYVG